MENEVELRLKTLSQKSSKLCSQQRGHYELDSSCISSEGTHGQVKTQDTNSSDDIIDLVDGREERTKTNLCKR